MRAALLFGLLLLSSASDAAAEFSVLDTRLGMTDGQINQSLPADLKSGARRDLLNALGELPLPAVRVLAGPAECEWARWKEYGKQCLSYSALLIQKDNVFSTISISVNQYFVRPIPIEDAEQQIIEAFGEPSARVNKPKNHFDSKTGLIVTEKMGTWPDGRPVQAPPFSLLPMWVWTTDLTKLTDVTRNALFQPISNLGRTGARAPLLRVFLNVDNERVLGMAIVLIDPIGLDQWNEQLEAARTAHEKETSDQIRLK